MLPTLIPISAKIDSLLLAGIGIFLGNTAGDCEICDLGDQPFQGKDIGCEHACECMRESKHLLSLQK